MFISNPCGSKIASDNIPAAAGLDAHPAGKDQFHEIKPVTSG